MRPPVEVDVPGYRPDAAPAASSAGFMLSTAPPPSHAKTAPETQLA
jgi:hypothetical protein